MGLGCAPYPSPSPCTAPSPLPNPQPIPSPTPKSRWIHTKSVWSQVDHQGDCARVTIKARYQTHRAGKRKGERHAHAGQNWAMLVRVLAYAKHTVMTYASMCVTTSMCVGCVGCIVHTYTQRERKSSAGLNPSPKQLPSTPGLSKCLRVAPRYGGPTFQEGGFSPDALQRNQSFRTRSDSPLFGACALPQPPPLLQRTTG